MALNTTRLNRPTDTNRRRFLRTALACAGGLVSAPLWANTLPTHGQRLAFHNLHTGERLKTVYRSGDRYLPHALAEINHILRDFRTGEVTAIDPSLLDLLNRLHREVNAQRPFEVISGYRSPQTNAMLRANSNGVAKHSLHMEGKAIDIRLPGVPLADLRQAALDLRRGGVGYYPKSDFVHVDTGRVRHW